jgi:hypothetical protein
MEYTVKLRLLNPQAVAKMPDACVVRRFVAYELESRGLSVRDFNLFVVGLETISNQEVVELNVAFSSVGNPFSPELKPARYVLMVLGKDGSLIARHKVVYEDDVSSDDAFLCCKIASGGYARYLLTAIGGWQLSLAEAAK